MKSVTYLLARRYLWNRHQEHTISLMILIAGISIFIGSFSLALVTAIMNGFEYTVHEKMKNIHPSATIYAHDPLNIDAIAAVISKEFPEVTAVSPTAIGHVLINTSANEDTPPIVAMLKGIHPSQESLVSAIGTKLLDNRMLDQAIHHTSIALGKELAHSLALSVGDAVSLFYIEQPESKQKKVSIEHVDAIVGGIFDTGIDEYDASIIYCSLPFFATLFPEQGITQIGLSFMPNASSKQLVHHLQQRLCLDVHTWQELYPALFAALVLEKYAMFFILLLITLVASMNIIALIFMLISSKKADIAILSALGMGYQQIQYLFMFIGISLSSLAALLGVTAAWIASILLETYPFIQLPDVYYVSHLPARMTFSIATIVFLAVLFIAWIASWFATRRIRSINISHTLRFEG
jgi:lipoprotein-releasing system permease protein